MQPREFSLLEFDTLPRRRVNPSSQPATMIYWRWCLQHLFVPYWLLSRPSDCGAGRTQRQTNSRCSVGSGWHTHWRSFDYKNGKCRRFAAYLLMAKVQRAERKNIPGIKSTAKSRASNFPCKRRKRVLHPIVNDTCSIHASGCRNAIICPLPCRRMSTTMAQAIKNTQTISLLKFWYFCNHTSLCYKFLNA
ncbi:hypothetical protein O181_012938 [Austropuccinia psidii MF-1]|uniref:Uncharacterized protein n=1 Tax=Austropuccinia psidii MF-1 TaxID=1389203 RepID=A0A9Q3BXQ4_9BASI|nr:hypothetical protein [Austropuccinia psidii MF-1]